jgi:hypothetical protein
VAQVDGLGSSHAQRSSVLAASANEFTQWQKQGEALGKKEEVIMKFAKRTNTVHLAV